jgi:N-methylhydantoinase A/oxoprolinase/acetone carboxylase beta subunit
VTDAALILGYLDRDRFLGGQLRLDVDAARTAVGDAIASRLSVSVDEAAWSIFEVANESMAAAARVHAAERGYHTSTATLIATGGGGPLHAFHIARKLHMREILIPPLPGVGSAYGLLVAPLSFDFVTGYMSLLHAIDANHLDRIYDDMKEAAAVAAADAGVDATALEYTSSVDLQYLGQMHEVTVELPSSDPRGWTPSKIEDAFSQAYFSAYGRLTPGFDIQAVNWRLRADIADPWRDSVTTSARYSDVSGGSGNGDRLVYEPAADSFVPTPIMARTDLLAGWSCPGPIVIQEPAANTYIGSGATVLVEEGDLLRVVIDG